MTSSASAGRINRQLLIAAVDRSKALFSLARLARMGRMHQQKDEDKRKSALALVRAFRALHDDEQHDLYSALKPRFGDRCYN